MPDSIDVGAYLARIEWDGPVRPNFDTLCGVLRAHMRRIPFENLDVLLGRGIPLDLVAVQSKLVASRRGGYCFEHATLFAAALDALGFSTCLHSARVVLLSPATVSPRTHMFATVSLPEGTFVVDPGFGALAPEVPVALALRDDPSHAGHWMARDGRYRVLRARTSEKIVDCWVSTLEADNPADFVVANHYTATHPSSPFRNRLLMRAATETGRVTVQNREVTIRNGTETRTYEIAERRELRAVIAEHFGFDMPEVETLRVPSIAQWQ